MKERKAGVERRGHLPHLFEDQFGPLRLGDLGVRQPLDDLHRGGGTHGTAHWLMQQKRFAPGRGTVDPASDPRAEQAVALAQMMVQEAQRCADSEGVKPQGDLGQLDRHQILVDAIDAALQDHATDDMSVVELGWIDGPPTLLGVPENGVADGFDPAAKRRRVITPRDDRLGFGHCRDDFIGQIIDKTYEEVARGHNFSAPGAFQPGRGASGRRADSPRATCSSPAPGPSP
jgi:hypothetical protein